MLEFFIADQNMLFAVILAIVGIFAAIELIGMTFAGLDIAGLIDGIFPDIDIDLDIDADVDAGIAARVFGWLKYKEVPLIVALFIMMGSISIIGYTIQYIYWKPFGSYLSWWIPTLISLIPAIFITRYSTMLIGKFLTQTHSTAVSTDDLVGKLGYIIIGTAKKDTPAEAKVFDEYGHDHYIRVIPKDENKEFTKGTNIITVRRCNNIYEAIEDTDPIN